MANKNSLTSRLKRIISNLTNVLYYNILWYFCSLLGIFLRKTKILKFHKYDKMKSFANIHTGQRCFIVCTGPSLTFSDLEKLKNEVCFGMNSIVKIFSQTSWRPAYYGIVDSNVYEKIELNIEDAVQKKELSNIFTSNLMIHQIKKTQKKYSISPAFNAYPVLPSFHLRKPSLKLSSYRFSGNSYFVVHGGNTVTYALLQIAVHMGFRQIYLLGCDCDYSGDKQHFVEHGLSVSDNDAAISRMTVAYKTAKKYADKHGIKIYNATRGGKLEVFERVDLDEALKQK